MDPRWHALMFAVLDGEATPEESRELELLLTEYELVRDEYASIQLLFERLRSAPQLYAPQGLADAALDRKHRNAPPERRSRRSGSFNPRRRTMTPNRSKSSIWIGGGIAVAAVLAVAFFTIDYPPQREQTVGTVAPAQRYRAEQPKAGDVKLGDQAVAQLMQTEAFDRFVKDPSTRALAADPNFQILARTQPQGLIAIAAHPEAAALVAAQAEAIARARSSVKADAVENARANVQAVTTTNAQTNAQLARSQADSTVTRAQIDAVGVNANVFARYGPYANALQSLATAPQTALLMGTQLDALTVAAKSENFAMLAGNQLFPNALVTFAESTRVEGVSTR